MNKIKRGDEIAELLGMTMYGVANEEIAKGIDPDVVHKQLLEELEQLLTRAKLVFVRLVEDDYNAKIN